MRYLLLILLFLGCASVKEESIGDNYLNVSPPKQEVKSEANFKLKNMDGREVEVKITPVKAWSLSEGFKDADLTLINFYSVHLKPNEIQDIKIMNFLPKGKWEFWVSFKIMNPSGFTSTDIYSKVRVLRR